MLHVLIVDDQPYLFKLFPCRLLGENCHITDASDKESVKRCLEDSMPDIVLLEISLHGFEGWELLHDIKIKYPDLPVLIVTAYDNYSYDPRSFEADGYMIKDFIHLDLLQEKINKILAIDTRSKVPCPRIEGEAVFPLSRFQAQATIS